MKVTTPFVEDPGRTCVVLVANWDWVLFNFRLPLVRALESTGLDVLLVCPSGTYSEAIRAQGFNLIEWKLDRKSMNPLQELKATLELARLYRRQAPSAVHHFTIKPILYGSLAAKLAGVPTVINNFTGLGYLFSPNFRAGLLRAITLPLLALLARARGIFTVFQTHDDFNRLSSTRIIPQTKQLVIEGTGVDLDKFQPSRDKETPPIVFMAARLLHDKGIKEFIEAAEVIKARGRAAQFWVAGRPDSANPSSIPEIVLEKWSAAGHVTFLGHRRDMANLLAQATVAVLPSYHEGVPLFLLEAAASGLPLVGTDIEGCRLVIQEGENGFLVPKADARALAEAIQKILDAPALQVQMGQQSRKIAEQRFGQEIILRKYLELYKQLGILGTEGD